MSDDDIDRITHLNAMQHFQYDPFTALGGRENCTVGALRQRPSATTSRSDRRGARNVGKHANKSADFVLNKAIR